jgi:hypothetical protein
MPWRIELCESFGLSGNRNTRPTDTTDPYLACFVEEDVDLQHKSHDLTTDELSLLHI